MIVLVGQRALIGRFARVCEDNTGCWRGSLRERGHWGD
jgi:hypothetical protein